MLACSDANELADWWCHQADWVTAVAVVGCWFGGTAWLCRGMLSYEWCVNGYLIASTWVGDVGRWCACQVGMAHKRDEIPGRAGYGGFINSALTYQHATKRLYYDFYGKEDGAGGQVRSNT
jgi:hypothetical protein